MPEVEPTGEGQGDHGTSLGAWPRGNRRPGVWEAEDRAASSGLRIPEVWGQHRVPVSSVGGQHPEAEGPYGGVCWS